MNHNQPPPYEEHQHQQGFVNPGYQPGEGQGYTQGYYPPIMSTQEQQAQGYPQQQGMAVPIHQPQQVYTQPQVYNSPQQVSSGYSSHPQQGSFHESQKQVKSNHSKNNGPVDELSGFGEKAVRRGFIRKVYSILMCQLLVTGGIMALFMFVKPIKSYVQQNMWVYLASFIVTLVCIIAMACFKDVRRTSPGNFICLGIFTICESFMLGTVATYYDVDAVMMAVGITAAVTLGLTLFAFQTKIDFTMCGGFLFCMLLILILAGIIMAFLPSSRWTMIGYASAGALLFCIYIIYDTQIMMGGLHKYSVSPEEYIFAALNLYLDIINLFLYILMIIGASKK